MIEKCIRRKLESSACPQKGYREPKKCYILLLHTYILLLSNCTKRSRKKFQTLCTPHVFAEKKWYPTHHLKKKKEKGYFTPKKIQHNPPKKIRFCARFSRSKPQSCATFSSPMSKLRAFSRRMVYLYVTNRYISVPLWYEKNNNIKTKNSSDFFWCICIIIKTKSFRTQI